MTSVCVPTVIVLRFRNPWSGLFVNSLFDESPLSSKVLMHIRCKLLSEHGRETSQLFAGEEIRLWLRSFLRL